MRLIPAKDLIHHPAREVRKWSEIKDDAVAMCEMVTGEFPGLYERAYALSHCQVDAGLVFAFFVLHPDLVGRGKAFKHQIIINPRIVANPDKVLFPGKWPKGKERPMMRNSGPLPEACMSFPWRKEKPVVRSHQITVEYQTPWLLGLRKHHAVLTGLAARIFQHETDHANGKNIYH